MRQARSKLTVLALTILVLGSSPAFAQGFGRSGSGSSGSSGSSSSGSSSSGSKSSAGRSSGSSSSSRGESGSGFGRSGGRSSGSRSTPPSRGGTRVRRHGVVYGPSYYDPLYLHPYDRWRMGYYYGAWGFMPWGYYGYGYTPMWGVPEAPEQMDYVPPPRELTSSLFVGGFLANGTGGIGGAFAMDGRIVGFNLRGLAVGLPDPGSNRVDAMPMWSGHLTLSPVSTPNARVRVEMGLSAVVAPEITYYGPDIGASAQLALVGPLGVFGSAHYTPFPATIADVEAGVSMQFGSVGMRGGWRALRLDDRNANPWGGGRETFSGPSLSFGTVF